MDLTLVARFSAWRIGTSWTNPPPAAVAAVAAILLSARAVGDLVPTALHIGPSSCLVLCPTVRGQDSSFYY
jgi:hypothetical protein